jgi:hypothetical protein
VLAALASLVCGSSLVGIAELTSHQQVNDDLLRSTKHAFQRGRRKAGADLDQHQKQQSSNILVEQQEPRSNRPPAAAAGIVHITVSVSNLTTSTDWYARALPVVPMPRTIRTSVRGAWFRFTCCFDHDPPHYNESTTSCCCPTPSLCDTQLHLLEQPAPETATSSLGADITGQHIGLDLGVDLGIIREILFKRHIHTTLAPDTTAPTSRSRRTQALFVSDPDRMASTTTRTRRRRCCDRQPHYPRIGPVFP